MSDEKFLRIQPAQPLIENTNGVPSLSPELPRIAVWRSGDTLAKDVKIQPLTAKPRESANLICGHVGTFHPFRFTQGKLMQVKAGYCSLLQAIFQKKIFTGSPPGASGGRHREVLQSHSKVFKDVQSYSKAFQKKKIVYFLRAVGRTPTGLVAAPRGAHHPMLPIFAPSAFFGGRESGNNHIHRPGTLLA